MPSPVGIFIKRPAASALWILRRTANNSGSARQLPRAGVHRKLGVTNCVDEQDMRDLKPDFLFNFSGHINAPTARTRMIYNLDSTADSREQSPPREIAAHCNGSLPIPIQFVYSFQIFVPVVQRIEQGFPKAKRSRVTKRVTQDSATSQNDFGFQLGDEVADFWRRLIYPVSSVFPRRVFGKRDRRATGPRSDGALEARA